MTPSTISVVERKKKRRMRGEGADPSVPAPSACEPRYRRRMMQRQRSQEPGAYSSFLSF
jgi:hypothetical protein